MVFKYKCACCNHLLTSQDKTCTVCGSQHIKSPINLWFIAIMVCFIAVAIFKVGQIYLEDKKGAPTQQSLFSVIEQGSSKQDD